MLQQPTVSVVMCTYNGEPFIDEQVQSIVQQEVVPDELIIVDDRSTDGTWKKLQAWQHQHPFIRLVQNEQNLGYNRNFEKAIRLAGSELIAIADQDDIWLPQKISHTLPAFADPKVMLAHCRSVQLKDGKLAYRKTRLHYHFQGSDVRRFFFFGHVMGHDAIFRSSLLKHLFPFPDGIIYDWWIAVNALANGSIASIPEFLVHHRIHSHNNFFSTTVPSNKQLDINERLRIMAAIPELKPADKQYVNRLIELLEEKMTMTAGSFSPKLFKFLYRHRHIIFGHKRRSFPEITYLKTAIKYARFDYKGKGMFI